MSNWMGLREDQRVGKGLVAEIGKWLASDTGGSHLILKPYYGRKSSAAPCGHGLVHEVGFRPPDLLSR